MSDLLLLHYKEQAEAHLRDFDKEWLPYVPKLVKSGMDQDQLLQLRFRCLIRYLKRNGFPVDDFLEQA